jgi:hypothetical protein
MEEFVVAVRDLRDDLITCSEESYRERERERERGSVCVCLVVFDLKPSKLGGLRQSWAVAPQKKGIRLLSVT